MLTNGFEFVDDLEKTQRYIRSTSDSSCSSDATIENHFNTVSVMDRLAQMNSTHTSREWSESINSRTGSHAMLAG